MKKILLTGGAGFIGSHIAAKYLENNYQVIIVDDLSSGKMTNIQDIINHPNLFFHEVSICDFKQLENIFQTYKPNIINHHAAQKSGGDSVINPHKDLEINLKGLLNLIELTKKYPIEKFIYVSSGGALSREIYDETGSCEDDLPQFKSPYAINKYAGEKYLGMYSEIYQFNYTVLRYANVYGPRQIADGECGVIPIFVDNILDNIQPVLMTYSDMPRGCTRDYVNIEDVVTFNLLVSENEKANNKVYNVASGLEIPILDIYEQIADIFETDLKIKITGPRLGDIKRSVLNNELAKVDLNFSPKISLEQGIKNLKTWYENK